MHMKEGLTVGYPQETYPRQAIHETSSGTLTNCKWHLHQGTSKGQPVNLAALS